MPIRPREIRDAIETVAQQIAHDQLVNDADLGSIDWGDYPEIGEHDWDAVVEEIASVVTPPSREAYQAAYDLLTDRAERADA